MHAYTSQNKTETARRTGFDRRALAQWIDPERLARTLREPK
jgi:hypothetical protein